MQLTLATLRRNVAAKLGLENTTGGDQILIDHWLNEGYEQTVLRSRCSVAPGTVTLTSGQDSYTMDTAIMALLEVDNQVSSTRYTMEQITLTEMLKKRRATSTAPARYWAVRGNLIEVYPTPGTGETLNIWYVPRPTALSASSDSPTAVPYEFHKLIELYACAEGGEYTQHEASQFGSYYRGLFEKGLMEMNRALNRKAGTRVPRAKVGNPDNKLTMPSTPSQDVSYYW